MTRAEYEAKYGVAPAVSPTPTAQPVKMTRAEYQAKYGVTPTGEAAPAPAPVKKSTLGTLMGPAKEGIDGLKTLYGGGEQGIARKLANDVSEGAKDYAGPMGVKQLLGPTKTAFRTAGDVAGTVFAPVGAVIGATGVGKLFDKIGEKIVNNPIGDKLTDNKTFQNFATAHPNAGEDFGRALNLIFAAGEKGKIDPKTVIERTDAQVMSKIPKIPKIPEINVEKMRADKIKSGFEEQNTRLKSVEKSFNENTKSYSQPDGTKTKVTPIDTLMKHNIAPVIENGGIHMGDYKTGEGALGKIKEKVIDIDNQVDTHMVDSGKGVSLEQFRKSALERIAQDSTLKQSGKVSSTQAKLNAVFKDFKKSYGSTISEVEINKIRKVMNQDWHPDTMDVSHIVGDTARQIVYDVTPNEVVKNLLREQGELLSAKKYAETINGTKVTGGRLGNMAMRTGGAIIGSSIKGLPFVGPLLGMIGGEYAARAMQQSQFKSFPAEAKALFQRSKSIEPTTKANKIPSKSVIPINIPEESFIDKGIKAGTKAVKDFAKNPKMGMSVEDITKKISPAEKGTMRDFMDYVAGEYKPHSEQARRNLMADAQDIATKYGLKSAFGGDKSLSSNFGKVLNKAGFKK